MSRMKHQAQDADAPPTRLRRVAVAAIAASLIIVPPQALQAGVLDTMLADMYVASGSPGVYKTQNATVMSLGYTAVRTPIMAPNIISFSPPNISAGCGGINMYFGSWSFINGQQLQQLITAIGQAAPVFLFEMAIRSMCPTCAAQLDKLQQMIQQMNSQVHNSCQIARGILTGQGPAMLKSFTDSAAGMFSAAKGLVNDAYEGVFGKDKDGQSWWQRFEASANPPAESASGSGTPTKAGDTSPVNQVGYGNQTWKAIVTNNAPKQLVGSDDPFTAELLMSMVGTTIVADKSKANADAQNNASSYVPPDSNGNATGNNLDLSGSGAAKGLLSLRALVEGDPNARVMRCQSYTSPGGTTYAAYSGLGSGLDPLGCWRVTSDDTYTLGSNGYGGIRTGVNCVLFGNPGAYANNYAPGSATCAPWGNPAGLVNEVINGTPITNAAEQAVINASPIPIMRLMQAVSRSPAMVKAVASQAQPYIVAAVAVAYADAVQGALRSAFQGSTTFTAPPDYEQRMLTIETEKKQYVDALQGAVRAANDLEEYVNHSLRSMSRGAPGAAAR